MTIEAGPKPNGVRAAAADNRNQKNKSATTDGAGGGFGAILASLEPSETAGQPGIDPVGLATGSTARATSVFDPLAKDVDPSDASSTRRLGKGVDGLDLGSLDASIELADGNKLLPKEPVDALAALALPVSVPVPVPDAAGVPMPAPLDAVALLSQASQWLTTPPEGSLPEGQNLVSGVAQLTTPGVNLPHPVTKFEGAAAVPSVALDAPVELLGRSGKLQRDTAAKQALSGDVLMAPAPSVGQPESRSLPIAAKFADPAIVPIVVTGAATSSMMPARREDPSRERSVFRSNVTEGSALGQSFMSTTASTAVQYTPQLQMSPDVYVAEKVAYWISNDVQNAEMKLDGIGLNPVEVSIRMHGNEAHVVFRTDELQARAALENATTHLKELLQREGLVLAGVSVGTAGTGDSGDREGQSRQGARQANIAMLTPVRTDPVAVGGRVPGGRLDLFV
jgi:flagellar hook-length control protein FliK